MFNSVVILIDILSKENYLELTITSIALPWFGFFVTNLFGKILLISWGQKDYFFRFNF
jgi:hypothetical protein